MRLDRHENKDGKGKYILINQRKLEGCPRTAVELAEAILKNPEAVEFGFYGSIDEFFPIKLKDAYAKPALKAYADAAYNDGQHEFACDVLGLAMRSGVNHPHCKRPD